MRADQSAMVAFGRPSRVAHRAFATCVGALPGYVGCGPDWPPCIKQAEQPRITIIRARNEHRRVGQNHFRQPDSADGRGGAQQGAAGDGGVHHVTPVTGMS